MIEFFSDLRKLKYFHFSKSETKKPEITCLSKIYYSDKALFLNSLIV